MCYHIPWHINREKKSKPEKKIQTKYNFLNKRTIHIFLEQKKLKTYRTERRDIC